MYSLVVFSQFLIKYIFFLMTLQLPLLVKAQSLKMHGRAAYMIAAYNMPSPCLCNHAHSCLSCPTQYCVTCLFSCLLQGYDFRHLPDQSNMYLQSSLKSQSTSKPQRCISEGKLNPLKYLYQDCSTSLSFNPMSSRHGVLDVRMTSNIINIISISYRLFVTITYSLM